MSSMIRIHRNDPDKKRTTTGESSVARFDPGNDPLNDQKSSWVNRLVGYELVQLHGCDFSGKMRTFTTRWCPIVS